MEHSSNMINAINKSRTRSKGFTIVELLIVIVVISILAAITIVAYNGISSRASLSSLQSVLTQAGRKIEATKVSNGSEQYPNSLNAAGVTLGNGIVLNYQFNNNSQPATYCLTGVKDNLAWYISSTTNTPIKGSCTGVLADGSSCPSNFIVVPGNSTFGTNDFCIMKYEARNNGSGVPISKPSDVPWVLVSQADAIVSSANVSGCIGCHLISEAEWMTVTANVLSVASNWSGGGVGSGYIYSGHNDSTPANPLEASVSDGDGYFNTGQSAPSSQRRTLTLTNGEVIWDFSGNVWEWTSGTINGNQQPGLSSDSAYTWRQWNNGSLLMNGLPAISKPSAISAAVAGYSSTQGIGQLNSYYNDTNQRAFRRGGDWSGGAQAGVLALRLGLGPTNVSSDLGFRVTR